MNTRGRSDDRPTGAAATRRRPGPHAWRRATTRLVSVVLVASVMAVVGKALLHATAGPSTNGIGPWAFMAAVSSMLWIGLSFLLRGASMAVTVGVGVLSPYLGASIMCPVIGAVTTALEPQVLPVGIATALLVWTVVNWDARRARRRQRRGLCRQCRYDLRGRSSPVCPECGAPVVVALPAPPARAGLIVLIGLLTALVGVLVALVPAVAVGKGEWGGSGVPEGSRLCTSGVALALSAMWVSVDHARPRGLDDDLPPHAEVFRLRRQVLCSALGCIALPIAFAVPVLLPNFTSPLELDAGRSIGIGLLLAAMLIAGVYLAALGPRYRLIITDVSIVEQGLWRRRTVLFAEVATVLRPSRHVIVLRTPHASLRISTAMFSREDWRRIGDAVRRGLPDDRRPAFDQVPAPRPAPHVPPVIMVGVGAASVALAVVGLAWDSPDAPALSITVLGAALGFAAIGLGGLDLVRRTTPRNLAVLAIALGAIGAAGVVLTWWPAAIAG